MSLPRPARENPSPWSPRIPPTDGPLFLGLTGGVGAGKSTALRELGELGCATLSADHVVHEIQADPEVIGLVAGRFGDQVAPGGVLDRAALARLVFAEPSKREWLEQLLWPRVGQRISEWRSGLADLRPMPRAAVVEIPLLFESGMERVFDSTISVITDEDVRTRRAASRGHEAVGERSERQLSQERKSELADWTVRNDGSVADLREALAGILSELGV